MTDPAQRSGLFTSLRQLLTTVLELAQVRLALIGTELELEKRRLFDGLLWAALALLLLGVGLMLLCGFIVVLFWEDHRLTAIGVMALVLVGAGALLLRRARSCLSSAEGMFAASLAEIKRDCDDLHRSKQHEAR